MYWLKKNSLTFQGDTVSMMTFVISTDGLIGREAKALLKQLLTKWAEKSGQMYSRICGFVNACMSIAII